MDLLIYVVLVILVLTILYGVFILARVSPEWLRIPGTPEWIHKGGGKVVVNEDNEPREQFEARYRSSHRKGPLDRVMRFEILSDAQICVGVSYRKFQRKLALKLKWGFVLVGYVVCSILYYLTLFTFMPPEGIHEVAASWWRFGVLIVIIIIAPGFIIWNNWETLKVLWEGEE